MSQAAKRDVALSKDALLKSYRKRLKDDVRSMSDNLSEIVKLCRIEDETQVVTATTAEDYALEMQVRASNMVRAGESLMKLVSDLKQYLILNDFPSVNEAIAQNSNVFKDTQASCDRKLTDMRDEMATDLFELEEEYYSSSYK
jgi:mediator of RNA polymerase II transcription subunit 22